MRVKNHHIPATILVDTALVETKYDMLTYYSVLVLYCLDIVTVNFMASYILLEVTHKSRKRWICFNLILMLKKVSKYASNI